MNFQDLARSGTAPQAPRVPQEKMAARPRTRCGDASTVLDNLNADLRNRMYIDDAADGESDMSDALKFLDRKRAQQIYGGGEHNAAVSGKKESVASVYYAPAAVPVKKEKSQRAPFHLKPKTPSRSHMADLGAIYGAPSSTAGEIPKKPTSSSQRYRGIERAVSPTSAALASKQQQQQQQVSMGTGNSTAVPPPSTTINKSANIAGASASSNSHQYGLNRSSRTEERIKPKSRGNLRGTAGAEDVSIPDRAYAPAPSLAPSSSSFANSLSSDPKLSSSIPSGQIEQVIVEPAERTLERPQSRKLYLGTGISTSEGSPRHKSAGSIKASSSKVASPDIKRMNSYNNLLGSSNDLEKRPPSRQASAFPVHLAGRNYRTRLARHAYLHIL
jgi:hypothetical protein